METIHTFLTSVWKYGSEIACIILLSTLTSAAGDDEEIDWIDGHHSFIFRTASDQIFSGTDFRREFTRDRITTHNFLTISELKIKETDDYRIWGSGNFWYRHDWADPTFSSRGKGDISFASIQIDKGRTSDGFIKAGRIYNYRGLLNQRFDGGEIYYPFENGIELDLYGGSRATSLTSEAEDTVLGGGRLGYHTNRRSTVGFSWLLSHTDGQWDDQKIGGDWSFQPMRWLDISGNWGYDLIAEEFYEIQAHTRMRVSRDFDVRFIYDNVIPGLLIPKSSIFSVFSLAEEERLTSQFVYHLNRKWDFLTDFTYIDFDNDGGFGNFFSDQNRLDGGYQWRAGFEVDYRYSEADQLSFRFEKMVEGNFGYTITDAIRTDFDFRDGLPKDEGLAFGELENGFSSIRLSHWHQWSSKFSHALNFYYYNYDNPLFLHESGDDSFSSNLTLTYKPNPSWNISVGGRYIESLADGEGLQAFVRLVNYF